MVSHPFMATVAVRGTTHHGQIWSLSEVAEAISFVGPKPLILLFYCMFCSASPDVIEASR